ncbi:MAG: hypothetical protein SGJ09_03600 [Phycisphaerae bacterium]|nr:hypothetical protein [Phycisphaerae bacterium]
MSLQQSVARVVRAAHAQLVLGGFSPERAGSLAVSGDIATLTTDEQNAVSAFVKYSVRAFICTGNDGFGGRDTDLGNESIMLSSWGPCGG